MIRENRRASLATPARSSCATNAAGSAIDSDGERRARRASDVERRASRLRRPASHEIAGIESHRHARHRRRDVAQALVDRVDRRVARRLARHDDERRAAHARQRLAPRTGGQQTHVAASTDRR